MLHTNRKKTNRALLRFTLSYLVLLLIPLVMGIGMFAVSVRVVSSQTLNANTLVLEQSVTRMEGSLAEADSFAYALTNLPSVHNLMLLTHPLTNSAIYTIYETMKDLSQISDSNGLFASYFLYFSKGEFILEPNNCYRNAGALYGAGFYYGNLDAKAWSENVLQSRDRSFFLPAMPASDTYDEGARIVYCRGLTYLSRQLGKIIYFIDDTRLQDLFSPLYDLSAEFFIVLDKEGGIVTASQNIGEADIAALLPHIQNRSGNFDISIENRRMIVSYALSEPYEWTVLSATPYASIIGKAGTVLMPMLIGITALMVFGVLLSVMMLRSNRKPLAQTLERLPLSDSGGLLKQGLWQLDQAVRQLASSNDLLSNRLEEQRNELRAALASGLEGGVLLEDNELEVLLAHVGVQPEGNSFRGVYLKLSDEESIDDNALQRGDYLRALVLELLAPYAQHLTFLALKNYNTFLYLYAEYDSEPEDLHALFGRIYSAMRSMHIMEPVFYVGAKCSSLRYISRSLKTARQIKAEAKNEGFLFIAEDMRLGGDGYVYTERHEQSLLSLASVGKIDAIGALLDDLQSQNAARRLTQLEKQLLMYRMASTLRIADPALPFTEEFDCALYKLEPERFFELLHEHYRALCESVELRRTQRTAQLVRDITDYLDSHYAENDLCLYSVSLRFGMTEKSLSAFFREKSGVHFSTYLEQLRLRKANELLSLTKLTLEEIAQKIGYSNGKTFRRAYQRTMGVSPTEFRKAGGSGSVKADA